jgi:HK97 family phage prohead protease
MDKLLENIKAYIAFADEKTVINEAERKIRFVISSDKIDRDNERIEVSAIAASIKDFAKNPVALASHTHRDGGKPTVIGHWDTNSFKAFDHQSEMDLIFADTELGEEYWQLYKGKHMRAVSIGFRPIEYHEEVDVKNGRVVVFTKIELFEVSVCAVGSNREALSKIKAFLNNTSDTNNKNTLLQAMCEIMHEDMNNLGSLFNQLKNAMAADLNEMKSQIEEIKTLLIPDSDGLAKNLLLGEEDFEQPDPAEKDINAEQIKQALETLI